MFKLAGPPERFVRNVLLAAIVSSMPVLSIAEDNLRDELKSCAAFDDGAVRLSCYDRISGRQDEARNPVREDPEVASAPVSAPPDNFGAETLHRDDEKKAKEPPVAARVSRCSKDVRDKYIFYLEGGQVWKQVSDKRLYFKDCNFGVSIRKDFFGYKMQLEDSKKKFRVSRIR
jgi:hypothetical protein